MSITPSTKKLNLTKIETANLPGKLPPQAIELEEAVLGAMMLENHKLADVIDIITSSECFYSDANQKVYDAILKLFHNGGVVDMLTVTEELRRQGNLDAVGGPYYITKLTYAVVSSANVEYHALIIVQKYIQRELIRLSSSLISMAYEETTDVFDLLDTAEKNLYDISDKYLRKNFTDLESILNDAVKEIEHQTENKEDFIGVPAGYRALDHITSGWQKTDLIILAARPSVGKTAFAINLLMNAATHKESPSSVAFFSLEMSTGQIVKRMLSSYASVPMGNISKGEMEPYEMEILRKKSDELKSTKMFLNDQAALSIMQLRAECRRIKQKHGLDMIVIDYLQLMTHGDVGKNSNRENEVSKISRDLKALAKELKVPIIALSQLNRSLESRKSESKMPQLSDLRESGAIEQDADMVMFLYRPAYHGLTETPNGEPIREDTTILSIAKHRNGSLGKIYFQAQLDYQRFVEIGNEEDYNNMLNGSGMGIGSTSYSSKISPIEHDPSAEFKSQDSTLKVDDVYKLGSKMNSEDFFEDAESPDDSEAPETPTEPEE